MPNGPRDPDDELTGGEPSPLGAAAPLTVGREPSRPRTRRRPRRRTAVLAAVAVIAVVLLALAPSAVSALGSGSTMSGGLVKTPRDRVGISYGGGPLESTHFQRIVQPGSSLFWNGLFDPLYLYPADQVNYIVSKQAGEGATNVRDSIVAPTRDRVQVDYQVAVYFKLNTDELRAFHEQLGLRYEAYTTSGWNRLIRDTFRQQIENALQEETRRVDVADLFGSADVLVRLQSSVQNTLSERLEAALGQRFFCAPTFRTEGTCGDPTFVIKKVEIPASVAKAFEANRTSEIQVLTKTNEIAQRQAEAQAIAALGLTGQEYVTLKAIESGDIDFWVLPGDAGVTLTAPGAPAAPTGR